MKIIKREEQMFTIKGDGDAEYTVCLNPFSCTCATARYRNFRHGKLCKHIMFLQDELSKGVKT